MVKHYAEYLGKLKEFQKFLFKNNIDTSEKSRLVLHMTHLDIFNSKSNVCVNNNSDYKNKF